MKVEFYFDPCCPFCWITSRWLLMVQPERDIDITWKQFSLALKNGSLEGKDKTHAAKAHADAHRINRVILAANQQNNAKPIDLYTAFGIPYHVAGDELDNELIKKVLTQKQLPESLLESADDTNLDAMLQANIDEATEIAGEDIGVPTIVFVNQDGDKVGYFGPVLQALPDKPEALKLWDGLSQLASDKNFYELKRSRPSGGPDVFSTAKC